MATKIVLEFTTTEGNKKITLNNAAPAATSTQVKTSMQSFVTNGTVFLPQITGIIAAYTVTTTQEDFDLSD